MERKGRRLAGGIGDDPAGAVPHGFVKNFGENQCQISVIQHSYLKGGRGGQGRQGLAYPPPLCATTALHNEEPLLKWRASSFEHCLATTLWSKGEAVLGVAQAGGGCALMTEVCCQTCH